jgi:hypothetical protein
MTSTLYGWNSKSIRGLNADIVDMNYLVILSPSLRPLHILTSKTQMEPKSWQMVVGSHLASSDLPDACRLRIALVLLGVIGNSGHEEGTSFRRH